MKVAPLLLLAAALGSPALAGYQVEQRVAYTMGGKAQAVELQFTWQLTEREFRLDVRRGAESRTFVFNGRVFYVCGRLGKAQLDQLRVSGLDPGLAASLEKGACRELPTDFAVKFFMSPYAALTEVEIDSTGAMGATLEFAEVRADLTGAVESVQQTKCVGFSRSYQLVGKDRAAGDETVSEKACNATGIHWRGAIARELGMTLLRQPGGRRYYQTLTSDLKTMAGLTLMSSGKTSGHTPRGAAFTRTFEVTTTALTEHTPSPAEVGLPTAYELIDTKTRGGLSARRAPEGVSMRPDAGSAAGLNLDLIILGGLIPY